MVRPVLAMALFVSGCASQGTAVLPQSTDERTAQVQAAAQAVKLGQYEHAERLLADYLYRDADNGLRFKSFSLSSAAKKQATDTVALLLWETGRDASLETFAKRYLSGYERDVMLCRLAERNARYKQAFECWNKLGDSDRAKRVLKTEAALRILKD